VPKLNDSQCAHIIALACTPAPEGHDHWTLRLLADQVVQLGYAKSFSYEGIRRLLKNTLKPWQVQEWCIPEVGAGFVAAMEDVLDVYNAPYDPANVRERNAKALPVKWRFSTPQARRKLTRLYPCVST
jgi:hypothetical protein